MAHRLARRSTPVTEPNDDRRARSRTGLLRPVRLILMRKIGSVLIQVKKLTSTNMCLGTIKGFFLFAPDCKFVIKTLAGKHCYG